MKKKKFNQEDQLDRCSMLNLYCYHKKKEEEEEEIYIYYLFMFPLSFEKEQRQVHGRSSHLSFNICFSVITQSMMRENEEKKRGEYD